LTNKYIKGFNGSALTLYINDDKCIIFSIAGSLRHTQKSLSNVASYSSGKYFSSWSSNRYLTCLVIVLLVPVCIVCPAIISIPLLCALFSIRIICLLASTLQKIETWRYLCPLIVLMWLHHNTGSNIVAVIYYSVFIKCLCQCLFFWIVPVLLGTCKLITYSVRCAFWIVEAVMSTLCQTLCHQIQSTKFTDNFKHKCKYIHLTFIIIQSVFEVIHNCLHYWIRNPDEFEETVRGYKIIACEAIRLAFSGESMSDVCSYTTRLSCMYGLGKVILLCFNGIYYVIKVIRMTMLFMLHCFLCPLKIYCQVLDSPYVLLLYVQV
jgi:hypothetical protein